MKFSIDRKKGTDNFFFGDEWFKNLIEDKISHCTVNI